MALSTNMSNGSLRRWALVSAAALALGGCGSSGAPRAYSATALRACLAQSGESIVRFAAMPRSERAPLTKHLPGGFGVQFISGEFALFYVGKDAESATTARTWLQKTREDNRAASSSVAMSVYGDLFELIQTPETLATRDVVARCRSTARV